MEMKMLLRNKAHALAVLLAITVVSDAHARFRYNRANAAVRARSRTQVRAGYAMNYRWNYRPAYRFNYRGYGWRPYWGYWGGGYGYASGVAQVYSSVGQYQVDRAQASVINEQARQAAVDTRRKINDEWRYEQSLLPKNEDLRQRDRENASRRARNDPPSAEIWSGAAMNTLLKDILNFEGQSGLRGPDIPIDKDIVRRLNVVVAGTATGSVSLIREGQALTWPPVLQNDDFDAFRNSINTLLPQAVEVVKQGAGGKNEPLLKVLADLGTMKKTLDANVANYSADDWIAGNRFINQLRDSAKMMQKPNAANYFNGKWMASGNTVGDLLYNMGQKGLTFAPCAEGDEDAYNVAFRLMSNYDAGLAHMASASNTVGSGSQPPK
jgi:hypothetical protein